MKSKSILGVVFILAMIMTACTPVATEAPTLVAEPTSAPTEAATEASDTGAATVNVSESTTYGPILVSGEGMSLYLFMADTQNSGTSTCGDDDGCATEWPPLLTVGDPVAGDGVDSTLLGTITREDGSVQVTYNGWPLYFFAADTVAGDTNGQGIDEFGGLWYLVNPAGEAIVQ